MVRINDNVERNGTVSQEEMESVGVRLVDWRWQEVEPYAVVMGFIVLSGLAKLVFHRAHFISSRIPESCLLIIMGIVFGGCLYGLDGCIMHEGCDDQKKKIFPEFTPELFFYILLPPIILEAAYCLHNKIFIDNIGTILLFAVYGTILNFLMIGGLLILAQDLHSYLPDNWNSETTNTTEVQILLFSSLISAVDPVAVLAIFGEVGVNPTLYYLVFGESLLNDGVAVVFYNMMNIFAGMESSGIPVTTEQILIGIGSFFTVAIGGLLIGIFFGLLSSFITKSTSGVRVVEPLMIFGFAYLSYLAADLLNWSGIISLIGCGIVQAHYAFKNISKTSLTTVQYFIKILSSASDCIIFLYLGMAMFREQFWDTWFVCWTLLSCLIVRFLGVFFLTFIVNRARNKTQRISFKEQFIMGYGGLRGAVGFSLVSMIKQSQVPAAPMFVTTTLAVIVSTVFIQGGTIKFLVNALNIEKESDDEISISEEIHGKLMDNIMSGIEVISGKHGHFYAQSQFSLYDKMYLKKWFCVEDYDRRMKKIYEEISLADHIINLYGPSLIVQSGTNEASGNGIDNNAFDGTGDDSISYSSERAKLDDIALTDRNHPTFWSLAMSVKWLTSMNRNDNLDVEKITPKDKSVDMRKAFSDATAMPRNRFSKNWIYDEDQDMEDNFARKKENARKMREKIIKDLGLPTDVIRDMLNGDDMYGGALDGRVASIVAHLENLPVAERYGVSAVLRRHEDQRRRKSSTLIRDAEYFDMQNENNLIEESSTSL
eukprot:GFUD01099005.1.p1 GENE.GFUD01099005.1~~GFUD01099005.1.p1  ORF type:complete len:768 (+),score=151.85 GFUD01099005.1:146-2449(+)